MKNINKFQWRYEIISLLDKGMMTALDSAWELNLSIRHIRRLLAKFRQNHRSLSALKPKLRPPAWNGKTKEIIKAIIDLKKERSTRSNQYIVECVANKFLQKISAATV